MNRSPSGLKPEKAVLGFLQYKTAQGLSAGTLLSYDHLLRTWAARYRDVAIEDITADELRNHLTWLRTEYKPRRFSGSEHPLSAKSVRNAWVALCAFLRGPAPNSNLRIR